MRVLHVVDSLGPGAAGVSAAAAEMLAFQRRAGIDASFLTGDVAEGAHSSQGMGGKGNLLLRISRATRWADLVHIHALWLWTTTLAGSAAIILRRPYVITPHGMLDPWALSQSRWKKRAAWFISERRILNRAAGVHALCESEARAAALAGVRSEIHIIPPGLSESAVLAERREGSETHTLVFLGRLHPKKGIDVLLNAFARLVAGYPAWRLRIVGPDQASTLGKMRSLATRLGLDAVVSFEEPVFGEGKAAILDAASLFVLPSHSEGVPMAALEAMARGVPIVASRACNIPEIEKFGAGVLTEPNVDTLVNSLAEVMSLSTRARREMGIRGQQLVARRYSSGESGNQLIRLYEAIIADPVMKGRTRRLSAKGA